MALGAQKRDLLELVIKNGFALLAMGIAVGCVASFWLTKFIENEMWGVTIFDPWTYAAVVSVILLTGMAACYLPARRAAGADPMVALRYE